MRTLLVSVLFLAAGLFEVHGDPIATTTTGLSDSQHEFVLDGWSLAEAIREEEEQISEDTCSSGGASGASVNFLQVGAAAYRQKMKNQKGVSLFQVDAFALQNPNSAAAVAAARAAAAAAGGARPSSAAPAAPAAPASAAAAAAAAAPAASGLRVRGAETTETSAKASPPVADTQLREGGFSVHQRRPMPDSASVLAGAKAEPAHNINDSLQFRHGLPLLVVGSGIVLLLLFTTATLSKGSRRNLLLTKMSVVQPDEGGESGCQSPTTKRNESSAGAAFTAELPKVSPTASGHCPVDAALMLPRISGSEVRAQIEEALGYDCALAWPWSSGRPVRLVARVEGPVAGAGDPLLSPLTRQECVLYSASASRRIHEGMHPFSVAFASAAASTFSVRLLDDEELEVEVSGDDVLLLGAQQVGGCAESRRLCEAPEHWQTFATEGAARRRLLAEGVISSDALVGDDPVLEFQERALLVGATVTLVGELHRCPDGRLTLQPWRWHADAPGASSSASSSAAVFKEAAKPPACSDTDALAAAAAVAPPQVLVSDDLSLLSQA
eukprot:TRINITY_DN31268_c0_g1_i1.p1 TRINITY_DN31268_c0_g1~~TRINITY_DN31268_c0_g1_i1.p1  ORF type:complete len:554 (+),score=138.00 TRINITY_DN31268_c0_g1_i1:114-1775(+)